LSDALSRILELCTTLGACAQTMDASRAAHPVGAATPAGTDGDAPLWGGTVGAGALKINGASYWFDDIEPVYGELDELIRYATTELHESVLSDERVRALAPANHRVRAAYERDKELIQARNLVRAGDGRARLQRTIEHETYWALGEELRSALDGSRRIMVVGSGPLPLTALCIGSTLDVGVTCVERDAECHDLGRQLIAMSGLEERFESINADILDLTEFEGYDAIVGVVLLGVSTGGQQESTKATIAHHIIDRMSPGMRMVLRDPHGLGKLLYPSVDLAPSNHVDVTRHVPKVGPSHPYRSGLVVAERRSPGSGHAH
jgi:nicotianamine synthase